MSEILLLPEQQFTSVYVDGTGWCWEIPATFDLVPGNTYHVRYDGADYECVCIDVSAMNPNIVNIVAIGNGAAFGLPGNGEPFVVMDYIGGDQISILCLTDSANQNTHTISIYGEESVEPEEPEEPESPKVSNDAVLLSYSQNPVVYNNIPKVWLTHPNSTEENLILVPFTYGESVSKEVAPDFSGGDMAVEIPDGELVTGLTVKKPDELVPENIPEGQYIAGVGPGTFKGGSEGIEKTVELDFSGGDMTVEPVDGTMFSKVTIPVPETLIPENIAEGVNIAGIIGALAGGSSVKIANGTFTGNGSSKTVTHGLGVTPDIFIVRSNVGLTSNPSTQFLYQWNGVSTEFFNTGLWYTSKGKGFLMETSSTNKYTSASHYQGIETTNTNLYLNSANEQTIVVGAQSGKGSTYNGDYKWFAIGGLT